MIENIKQIMDGLDIAALLPDITVIMQYVTVLARLLTMVAPLSILGFGLCYYLAAPREANYSLGYRFRWGMGSVEAWKFTQQLAGIVWSILGLVMTVVFAIISSGFLHMEPMEMLMRAVACVLWEGGLIGAACIAIDITVFVRYDRQGNRRLSWRELFDR